VLVGSAIPGVDLPHPTGVGEVNVAVRSVQLPGGQGNPKGGEARPPPSFEGRVCKEWIGGGV
jgi:hypothetical protein